MTTRHQADLTLAMEAFADRLPKLREDRGLTQARLAELLETSPRVTNHWETGAALPRLDTLVQLADLLEVALDELVGRTEPHEPDLKIRNPKLHQLPYREIDQLSDEDQKALVILLDSLVKRSQVGKVLAG